jgi:hypothetical protein
VEEIGQVKPKIIVLMGEVARSKEKLEADFQELKKQVERMDFL